MLTYDNFLNRKAMLFDGDGFVPKSLNPMLKPFQAEVVDWSCRKGRSGIFADCGLGKTPMQLEWARQVVEHTSGNVLITTPLAVAHQTIREANKFGIEAHVSRDGKPARGITVTNYQKLHLFDPANFVAVVCDESSILKNFDGATRKIISDFMQGKRYRLLCTATAAPNDYTELGTSSEALGIMGHITMLGRFFKNDTNTSTSKNRYCGSALKWRFKKHAEQPFWQWVCSWARTFRKPSDLGYDDAEFILPELMEQETIVPCSRPLNGKLFIEPAHGLSEQREERRSTILQRCEAVAEKVNGNSVAVVWCHLNDEGDLLEKLIPGARQVKGSMPDEKKEEVFDSFASGQVRVLVTKPKIGAFGLNWQHCNHITFFPSHSYEQYYQGVRRCWRFGQTRPVTVDIVTTQGELEVLKNIQRKSAQATRMFNSLVKFMNDAMEISQIVNHNKTAEVPSWL